MKFVDLQNQIDKQFQQMQDQMKVLFSYRSKSTNREENPTRLGATATTIGWDYFDSWRICSSVCKKVML